MTLPKNNSRCFGKDIIRKNVAFVFLAVLLASAGAMTSVWAQDQTATPEAPQQPDARPAEPRRDEPERRHGLGQQLAHDTREAAGEEADETAVFKQSAAVRFIARITGMDLQRAYWLCALLNFAVIGGILFWAARKYLPAAFRDRTVGIQKAMQEAQKASEEARRKLGDIEERLKMLDVEIAAMRNAAEKEGAAEEARIKAAAEEDARKIVASAEQEIAAAAKSARRELTAYAADLAVALAKRQIHVDAATDQGLVRNFAGQLGASSDGKNSERIGDRSGGRINEGLGKDRR